ncbi:UDP-N-acetylmuramoyl-L-alanyl-D-glutamate--2,6-diaminopimelate ligase [Pseudoalteromonas sp. Of7M-16]|uniref:UDP-N-acetylmuramoyl-L-alanyl-D-glutamate--2, 6-diaminopimelate ligase n=1 Tax=Pseudoalteromonas sp. Of7M-16 TaxID=2917756 RepID=UPI001EF5BD82|nr:UDP-N-acetylmuramoyl-L-alanyl-D-glutamate--2,6-diaminopimelate ligase [Pseudoalteromonas sp. Of7M-16]MCG7547253.1 UDP-N-acetylmuramoyl-L-alanyl-D-glutamate--2,6-diaminopimelate ligase [Pseudoalteromonas sp. Of7M-16]
MRDLTKVLKNFGVVSPQISVNALRLDSREICVGDCFIAVAGHQLDGTQFISAAIKQGATCILVDDSTHLGSFEVPVIRVTNLKQNLSQIAAQFYQEPSTKMTVIGVTGTNGKSTTTAMIANLAQQCGTPSAVIGTLGYGEPERLTPLTNTTPSAVLLQQIFSELQTQYQQVAMEVSSHGIVQGRVEHVDFDIAVFTNLSRDHLDYHGDMENYARAKKRLFSESNAKIKVLNIDDAYAQQWLGEFDTQQCVVYGKQPQDNVYEHYVFFDNVQCHQNGISLNLNTSWGNTEITTGLFGQFNIYNLSAAIASLLIQGYALEQLQAAATKLLPVDGRMQAFYQPGFPTCIVDYAHTPEALELTLRALQQHVPGKVSCVFGCGGDRDKGKRPLMARAAEQFADTVIITSDNPRSEDPNTIISDIKAGLREPQYAVSQPDREKAIRYAIEHADENSVVLIAGKGHEDYQIIGNQTLSFCDRSLVKLILQGESA